MRHHRQRERALAVAHAELKASQERDRAAAVAAERTHIARELHDVVAHGVSLMVLQAGAARAVLESRPGQAREPLLAVEAAGRQALEDLHRMLGLLRTDGTAHPAGEGSQRLPAPDLTRLPELAERLRGSGLEVRLVTVGAPVAVSPGLSHCAYRVVQEGLTNVLKHAGGARASVVVTHADGHLRVEVSDLGGTRTSGADSLPSSGVGLLGLKERVALYGGTLQAGPGGGGWRLVADLPCDSALSDGARPGGEVSA